MSLSVFLLLAFDTKRFAEGLERGNAIVLHFKLKTNRYHIKILKKLCMISLISQISKAMNTLLLVYSSYKTLYYAAQMNCVENL